ncbi:MAG: hypothetical protein R3Y33_06875 [Clostridia bacterium]
MKKIFVVVCAVLVGVFASACAVVSLSNEELLEKITEFYDKSETDVIKEFSLKNEVDEIGMLLFSEEQEFFGEKANVYLNFDIVTQNLYGMQALYIYDFDINENISAYKNIYGELKSLYGEASYSDLEEYKDGYYPIMDEDEVLDFYENNLFLSSEWSFELDGEERVIYLNMITIDDECTITLDYRMLVYKP